MLARILPQLGIPGGLSDAAADLVGCCVLPGSLLLVGVAWWAWENVRFARLRRRRDLAAAGVCWKCGYDLRASKDRCPECGTRIDRDAGRDRPGG